jgi:metal-responsive CopG/Arc/MetJ family transcriptional regulator
MQLHRETVGTALQGQKVSLQTARSSLTVTTMTVNVSLPDELAEQIDNIAKDRSAFVAEAVRRLLRESFQRSVQDEVALINQFADELNSEAEDVLEYQVIS